MCLIRTVSELKAWFAKIDRRSMSLGFVPTMGYLHEGHCSLIKTAKAQNELVVVSVFINPTQFASNEDFENYPNDIDRDYKLATYSGADAVFYPEVGEIYVPGSSTVIEVLGDMTKKLCGVTRPMHFRGVTTIVGILFNIVRPNKAYFGQKDAQQALIIKKMVMDLHVPVEIIVCPTIRESDGLAMSSRNVYLSPEERTQAICINDAFQKAEEYIRANNCISVLQLFKIIESHICRYDLMRIEYIQILDSDTLENITSIESGKIILVAVAAKCGKTRLIDNKMLSIT